MIATGRLWRTYWFGWSACLLAFEGFVIRDGAVLDVALFGGVAAWSLRNAITDARVEPLVGHRVERRVLIWTIAIQVLVVSLTAFAFVGSAWFGLEVCPGATCPSH